MEEKAINKKTLKDLPSIDSIEFRPSLSKSNVYWRMSSAWKEVDKLQKWLESQNVKYIICQERLDSGGKSVKEHFHVWVEKLNVKKKTFSDAFAKHYPELKRKGKGGSHLKSAIKFQKDDFQFYYLFKNHPDSQYKSSHILSQSELNTFHENYIKLKQAHQSSTKYYRQFVKSQIPINSIHRCATFYRKYAVENNLQRPSGDDFCAKQSYCECRLCPEDFDKTLELYYNRRYNFTNY